MTNVELLKAICDALIAAVGVLKNRLDDCDTSEPDEALDTVYRPAHALKELREKGKLSVRSCNCLLRAGFHTMEDVVARVKCLDELKKIRNMGPHSLAEVLKVAHELGLKWRWEA